jgi:CheY-like chemotaxis protein
MAFILIVEDSDDVAPLEIALSRLDHLSVVVFTNGRDALEFIRRNKEEMAALITDLHLPFLGGLELIRAVRAYPSGAPLPVIVISGESDPAIRTRVFDLGANAFFTKPYSPAAIRRTLEGLLHAS